MKNENFQSLWNATARASDYQHLKDDIEVDVAIIGGGITGLSTAYALRKEGMRIAIFEAGKIASQTTGNTTAKITSMHDLKYAFLKNKMGLDGAKIYAESNEWAIGEIKKIVESESIDCEFNDAPQYAYAQTDEGLENLKNEFETVKKINIRASLNFHDTEIPFPIMGEMKFENQAYFHPKKYLLGLAKILGNYGVQIFEYTRVEDFKEGQPWLLHAKEKIIKAHKVIIATNYPVYDKALFFLRMNQSRSYALAASIHTSIPRGMYVGVDGDGITLRPYFAKGSGWLVFGGADHVTGDVKSDENPFEQLEESVKKHFPVKSIDYRWAAQDSMPIDRIPYIGKMPMSENMYVATGFGEWGMTTSMVAAKIISDLILGKKNSWEDFYAPSRVRAQAALNGVSSQISHVAKGFGSYVSKFEELDIKAIKNGEGKIMSYKGNKTATYKDEKGALHILSPKCTHMGCMVRWNGAESSWDCPCHGSRFDVDGEILNSPAIKKLSKVRINNKKE